MKKTWMPETAGILNIITGSLTLFGFLILIGFLIFGVFGSMTVFSEFRHWGSANTINISMFSTMIILMVSLPYLIIGIIGIIGGIYAIKRKIWGLALAGSICSVFTVWSWPLGVIAIVLLALSRQEFNNITQATPS